MKRSLLVLILATPFFSGCMATAMKMGESTIRSLTPANAGILTTGGNMAADTYKMVRGNVLGDNSLVPNDPATVNPVPQAEILVPAPAAVAPVPATPPPKKQPLAKKGVAKKS